MSSCGRIPIVAGTRGMLMSGVSADVIYVDNGAEAIRSTIETARCKAPQRSKDTVEFRFPGVQRRTSGAVQQSNKVTI